MKPLVSSAVLPVAVAAVLIVAVAVVDGRWGGRFEEPAPEPRAVAPITAGAWDREEGPARVETAPATLRWVYRRRRPAARAVLCLAAGHRRELALHGPEACYPHASLRLASTPQRVVLEGPGLEAEVWQAAFFREEPGGRRPVAALWTCRTADRWTAEGAGPPGASQVKLYMFSEEPAPGAEVETMLLDLAKALLPEWERALALQDAGGGARRTPGR